MRANKRRFLAKVRTIGRDDRQRCGITTRNLSRQPIDIAVQRADIA